MMFEVRRILEVAVGIMNDVHETVDGEVRVEAVDNGKVWS